ncbi:MAG: hypothetical protein AAF490_16240 [Chloroflexota bacterium]
MIAQLNMGQQIAHGRFSQTVTRMEVPHFDVGANKDSQAVG